MCFLNTEEIISRCILFDNDPRQRQKKKKEKETSNFCAFSIYYPIAFFKQLYQWINYFLSLESYCVTVYGLKKWVNYKLDLTASLLILLSHYFGHLVKLNWCLVWIYQPTNKCSNKFDARLHVHTFNHSFKV